MKNRPQIGVSGFAISVALEVVEQVANGEACPQGGPGFLNGFVLGKKNAVEGDDDEQGDGDDSRGGAHRRGGGRGMSETSLYPDARCGGHLLLAATCQSGR
jgi:hypothetical protein